MCCPTKIMDYMATGRPVVSTALPECQLYGHLFDVAPDDEAFVTMARLRVEGDPDRDRAEARFAWATENSCARVADRFLDWLTG